MPALPDDFLPLMALRAREAIEQDLPLIVTPYEAHVLMTIAAEAEDGGNEVPGWEEALREVWWDTDGQLPVDHIDVLIVSTPQAL